MGSAEGLACLGDVLRLVISKGTAWSQEGACCSAAACAWAALEDLLWGRDFSKGSASSGAAMSEAVRGGAAGPTAAGFCFCGISSGMASRNAASERERSAMTGLPSPGDPPAPAMGDSAGSSKGSSTGSGSMGRLGPRPGLARILPMALPTALLGTGPVKSMDVLWEGSGTRPLAPSMPSSMNSVELRLARRRLRPPRKLAESVDMSLAVLLAVRMGDVGSGCFLLWWSSSKPRDS